MATIDEVRIILRDTLQLGDNHGSLEPSTPLLGTVSQLDSMAIVNILTALEEQFDVTVEDDEIGAETFETVGSLCDFIEHKLAS